jgi:capsular exopolysaccharide synthesis family protein
MRQEEISNFNDSFERYKDRITNFSNDFEFGLFIFIAKRSLPVILAIIASILLLAFIYLRYTEPIFQASTTLQLENSDKANKVLQVSEYVDDELLSSEVELLRSRLLMSRTIDRMNLNIRYFVQGEVRSTERYLNQPFEVRPVVVKDSSICNTPIFINFKTDRSFNVRVNDEVYGDFTIGSTCSIPKLDFEVFIIQQDFIGPEESTNEYFFSVTDKRSLLTYFYPRLTVKTLSQTAKTIRLTVEDGNPALANAFVMNHVSAYMDYDKERKKESSENILHFIDNQLDTVAQNLRNAEFLLNSFKQEHKMTNLSSISSVYLDRLTSFQDDILAIELQEDLLTEVSSATERMTKEIDVYNLISLLVGTEFESTISNLLLDLQELLKEREELLFDVTGENAFTQSLDYRIDIQKRLIAESISSLATKLQSRRKIMETKEKEIERTFIGMPAKELEFARYQRLFDINEKYYTILLEKKIEYRISKAGFVTDNRVLEQASVPSRPISPIKSLTYGGAVGFALLISAVFLIIKYLLHNNITSLNEIAKQSQASIGILGLIPKFKENVPVSQLIIDKNPKSLIAESFRTIRTNLQFLDNTEGSKILSITSTISGEGKTFIAINLAGIIAYSGKKVILIDLDMRKPKIHKGFDVENVNGMSTVLIGKDSVDNCINKSSIDTLDFITAGPVPPNPSELVISEKMQEILDDLKTKYDLVVVDNPPVGLVTDGVNSIKNADYPIYIFRADYSKKHFVQNVDRLINENGISKLSVILNGVDVERNKYGYYYGYGYGYGYGYAYDSNYGSGYYNTTQTKKPWWKKLIGR